MGGHGSGECLTCSFLRGGDNPNAAVKLVKWLGLSGWVSQVDSWAPVHRNTTTAHRALLRRGIEALTSCQADAVDVAVVDSFFPRLAQDFARMGLLGVPYCSNLPKVFRCLCTSAVLS